MTIQERSKKYGCSGECDKKCMAIDTCPETKNKEFVATVSAALIILSFPIAIVILFILAVMRCL